MFRNRILDVNGKVLLEHLFDINFGSVITSTPMYMQVLRYVSQLSSTSARVRAYINTMQLCLVKTSTSNWSCDYVDDDVRIVGT